MSTNSEIAPLLTNVEGNKLRDPKPPQEVVEKKDEVKKEESTPISESVLPRKMTYAETLEKNGLTVGEAREIMEKILVQGYYEDTYMLGTVPIKFRTRTYADSVRTQHYLESESPTYNLAINEVIARYNLAASLTQFGDTKFEFPEDSKESGDKAFDRRYAFIMTKPYVVINKILGFLYKFDLKVAAVFSDGAPEDF